MKLAFMANLEVGAVVMGGFSNKKDLQVQ